MRNFTERLLQFRPNFKSRVSHSFTFTDCNTGHGDLDLLSQKRCPCTRLKDSTPKINRQMEVAFGTRLADDWLRAALNPGLASGCIIPSVCLHKSSSPQEIQAQESAGHAFILGPSSSLQWLRKWLHSRLLESVQQLARTLPTRYIQPNAFLWE